MRLITLLYFLTISCSLTLSAQDLRLEENIIPAQNRYLDLFNEAAARKDWVMTTAYNDSILMLVRGNTVSGGYVDSTRDGYRRCFGHAV